jgi:hypothetical protein
MGGQMRKILIALLIFIFIFIFSNSINSQILGNKVPDDKLAHFFLSGWITNICNEHNMEWWQTGLTVLSLSLIKESLDIKYTGADMSDVGWSMAGWAFSYPIEYSFDLAFQFNNKQKTDAISSNDKSEEEIIPNKQAQIQDRSELNKPFSWNKVSVPLHFANKV